MDFHGAGGVRASGAFRLAARLSLVAAFALMALLGWRKVGSPEIDFGRDIFVAWRISEGAVFQRDVAHVFGPLSSHLNGLAFNIFGASFTVLLLLNLLVAAGIVYLAHRLARRLGGESAAWVSCGFLILVFLFHQEPQASNYNFLAPYAHEASHAVFLTLLLAFLLDRWNSDRSGWTLRAAGCTLGLILLTKPEFALAATGGVLWFFHCGRRGGRLRELGEFAAWTATFPLAFLIWFTLMADPATAIRVLAMPYLTPFKADVGNSQFYRQVGGFDDPSGNLKAMLHGLFIVGLPVGLAWSVRPEGRIRERLWMALSAIVAAALTYWFGFFDVPQALPVFVLIALAVNARRIKKVAEGPEREKAVLITTLAVISFLLMLKTLLHSGFTHYGVFLALPGALLVTSLAAGGTGGVVWRPASAAALAVVAVLAGQYLSLTLTTHRDFGFTLGRGNDSMETKRSDSALLLATAEKWLKGNLPSGATFLVLPDSPVLNYLLRSAPPTPYTQYMPPQLAIYGEERMLKPLKESPPDFILVFKGGVVDYGLGDFGDNPAFGKGIMDWIGTRYELFARSAKVAPQSEREVVFYRQKPRQ